MPKVKHPEITLQLERAVRSGKYGNYLPPVRTLAGEFAVALQTMHKALRTVPFGLAILFSALTGDDRFGRRGEKAVWLVFILFVLTVTGGLTYLSHQTDQGLPSNPTRPFTQKTVVLAFYTYMMGQVIAYACNTRQRRRSGSPGNSRESD